MPNNPKPPKLTRYERKIARDASLKKGRVIQMHYHECTCTKKWLCKFVVGCPDKRRASCHDCQTKALAEYEKNRVIEIERNSGEEMKLSFGPEYDFIDQPWVSYKIKYGIWEGGVFWPTYSVQKQKSGETIELEHSVQYVNSEDEVVPSSGEVPQSSLDTNWVKTTDKTPMSSNPFYSIIHPFKIEPSNSVETNDISKNFIKYIPASYL